MKMSFSRLILRYHLGTSSKFSPSEPLSSSLIQSPTSSSNRSCPPSLSAKYTLEPQMRTWQSFADKLWFFSATCLQLPALESFLWLLLSTSAAALSFSVATSRDSLCWRRWCLALWSHMLSEESESEASPAAERTSCRHRFCATNYERESFCSNLWAGN